MNKSEEEFDDMYKRTLVAEEETRDFIDYYNSQFKKFQKESKEKIFNLTSRLKEIEAQKEAAVKSALGMGQRIKVLESEVADKRKEYNELMQLLSKPTQNLRKQPKQILKETSSEVNNTCSRCTEALEGEYFNSQRINVDASTQTLCNTVESESKDDSSEENLTNKELNKIQSLENLVKTLKIELDLSHESESALEERLGVLLTERNRLNLTLKEQSQKLKISSLENRLVTTKQAINTSDRQKAENFALKALVAKQNVELYEIRRHSKVILSQRNDVERLLIDAIETAKEQKGKEMRMKSRKRTKERNNNFSRDERSEDKESVSSSRVSIKNLSWEEKEDIFVELFAKIQKLQIVKEAKNEVAKEEICDLLFDEAHEKYTSFKLFSDSEEHEKQSHLFLENAQAKVVSEDVSESSILKTDEDHSLNPSPAQGAFITELLRE